MSQRPKGSRPKKQNWMKQADVLFSKFIRARDGKCVACGSTDYLQCAHILTRSYKSIRVDPENAVTVCRGCHVKFTHKPLEWEDFIEAMFPGRWLVLRERALSYERVDWRQRVDDLRAALEEAEA